MLRCAAPCVVQRTKSTPHDPGLARLASGAFYEAARVSVLIANLFVMIWVEK
jgi:hypothetical protein